MITLVGIDPGESGGIAWQVGTGLPAVEKMPETEPDICELLQRLRRAGGELSRIKVYIEDVPIGMAGRGAAMAKLNRNAGYIRGVINALAIPMVMVRPVKWQEKFGVGKRSSCKSDTEWKNKLKQVAQRLNPHLHVILDTADALLVLEYARQQER